MLLNQSRYSQDKEFTIQVSRIDHVHIEVSDREKSADWYQKVLGLCRHPYLKAWADDPMGPLILCAEDGFPALSLFAREPRPHQRDSTIAFRVTGADFLKFCDNLSALHLVDKNQQILTIDKCVDHQVSWSLYFVDPDQNRIELTTYDYQLVAAALVDA